MTFPFRNNGVDTDGPPPVPADVYDLKITEATDLNKEGLPLISKKNGDPMVKCRIEITNGDHAGRGFWHWVTFIPAGRPGDGMAIKFLKSIGQPWEGEFEVKPEDWAGATFKAMVKVERDNQGKNRNALGWIADNDTVADEVPF